MTQQNPAAGSRGAQTRTRILDAARLRFGSEGYDRATIRAIALDAGVDPALVMRYFGNKDDLFAEALEFDLQLPDLAALPKNKAARTLVAHFLQRWEHDDTLIALLRSAAGNPHAAARLQSIFGRQVMPAIGKLSGAAQAEAARRASLVASQILGLAWCRYVLALPPLVEMAHEDIIDAVAPTLKRYIFGA
jgi:AcrR family transcriptional regulator